MSDTPRTDAEETRFNHVDSFDDRRTIPADFARQLERELASMTADRDRFKAALESIAKCDGAPDIDPGGDWQFGLHCGVDDRGLSNRYEGADFGHAVGVERALEWAVNEARLALNPSKPEKAAA